MRGTRELGFFRTLSSSDEIETQNKRKRINSTRRTGSKNNRVTRKKKAVKRRSRKRKRREVGSGAPGCGVIVGRNGQDGNNDTLGKSPTGSRQGTTGELKETKETEKKKPREKLKI